MTVPSPDERDARIDAQITATRLQRVEACDWATPAVRTVLAEHAADLRQSVPLSVVFDRIRRAVEADRAERAEPAGTDEPMWSSTRRVFSSVWFRATFPFTAVTPSRSSSGWQAAAKIATASSVPVSTSRMRRVVMRRTPSRLQRSGGTCA